ELALRRELDSGVERKEEGVGFLRELAGRRLGLAVRRAARVGQRDDLARLSADRAVIEVFEASQAAVVGPDVAEDVRRQASLRVDALGLREEVDSGDLPRPDARGSGAVHLPREPDETLLLR